MKDLYDSHCNAFLIAHVSQRPPHVIESVSIRGEGSTLTQCHGTFPLVLYGARGRCYDAACSALIQEVEGFSEFREILTCFPDWKEA
jgi:hypothetical protein